MTTAFNTILHLEMCAFLPDEKSETHLGISYYKNK